MVGMILQNTSGILLSISIDAYCRTSSQPSMADNKYEMSDMLKMLKRYNTPNSVF